MTSQGVEEYLAGLDPDRRDALSALRTIVLDEASGAVETMRYRMPTYEYRGGMLCAFASQKQYMSLYMEPDIVEQHRVDLEGLNVGKSCIRFRRLDRLPLETVRTMLRETLSKWGAV